MASLVTTDATVAGVPAHLWHAEPVAAASRCGTVLLYHGFGGRKERMAAYASALAEAGFLAVSLDAVGHGERRRPDFDLVFDPGRWDRDFDATESDFLEVIDDTVAEVSAVIDDLIARGWASENGVGICGRSLGGNVCYGAVPADSRVRAVTPVVGSPEWTLPRPHSPHHHPDRIFPAAVLTQAAEHDEHCPPEPIREFHARLAPYYASEPGRIEYVEYAGVGHFLTPALNEETCRRAVAWFQRWLSP
jgi:dienelactone hydrolase